jgi:hypothetical protein
MEGILFSGRAFLINFDRVPQNRESLNSVIGMAARYGLDCPGSNPRGSEILPAVKTDTEAHSDSCTMSTGIFPGIKRPRRGDNQDCELVGAIPPLPLCACRGRVFQLFQDVYNKFVKLDKGW